MNFEEEYKRLFQKIDIERVLDMYNIVYRKSLGKNGAEYIMRCPFPGHDDFSPSFCLNKETGLYNCFVCGGGNFFGFVKNIEKHATFSETISFIKKQLGIVDSPTEAFDQIETPFKVVEEKIYRKATQIINFPDVRLPDCEPAENYFDIVKKRVDINTIKRWKMLYCVKDQKYKGKYDGRLIIPVYFQGKLVTFAARDMLGRSEKWQEMKREAIAQGLNKKKLDDLCLNYEVKKYLYPYGAPTNHVFFNWDEALGKNYVILCEGIFSAIRVINYGYNAIALFSCNLNQYRANLIIQNFAKGKIYIAFDNDDKINSLGQRINPGQEHAVKLMKNQLKGAPIFNIVLPFGKDPDDCTKQEFDSSFEESQNFFKIW